jgi:hypothetical protein
MDWVKAKIVNDADLDMVRPVVRRELSRARRLLFSALGVLGGLDRPNTPRRSIDRELQQNWPNSE